MQKRCYIYSQSGTINQHHKRNGSKMAHATHEQIDRIAGEKCEITFRGEKQMTFSFEGRNDQALANLEKEFRAFAEEIESLYDAESDSSFFWITFK